MKQTAGASMYNRSRFVLPLFVLSLHLFQLYCTHICTHHWIIDQSNRSGEISTGVRHVRAGHFRRDRMTKQLCLRVAIPPPTLCFSCHSCWWLSPTPASFAIYSFLYTVLLIPPVISIATASDPAYRSFFLSPGFENSLRTLAGVC